jgi:hypothetical protein
VRGGDGEEQGREEGRGGRAAVARVPPEPSGEGDGVGDEIAKKRKCMIDLGNDLWVSHLTPKVASWWSISGNSTSFGRCYKESNTS